MAKHRVELLFNFNHIYLECSHAGPIVRELQQIGVDKMLQLKKEWAATIVLAPKKNGSLHFFVDYKKLNNLTRRNPYPIPRMDDCIDLLEKATIFSTLDGNSKCLQVEI